jgi:hypothetical protein
VVVDQILISTHEGFKTQEVAEKTQIIQEWTLKGIEAAAEVYTVAGATEEEEASNTPAA